MYFFFKWDIFKIKLRIYEYNIKKNKSIEVAYFSVEKCSIHGMTLCSLYIYLFAGKDSIWCVAINVGLHNILRKGSSGLFID